MKELMLSLSNGKPVDTIETLNSTSRRLDDLLIIDNPYSEGMISQIYPHKLQLNTANASATEAPFYLYLSISNICFFKFMISMVTLVLIYLISPFSIPMYSTVPLMECKFRILKDSLEYVAM